MEDSDFMDNNPDVYKSFIPVEWDSETECSCSGNLGNYPVLTNKGKMYCDDTCAKVRGQYPYRTTSSILVI